MTYNWGRKPSGRKASTDRARFRLRLEPLEDRLLLAGDIHTIQHVIMIVQENRSFDSYFGTYPGADGIPMINGVPTVSVPDPLTGQSQAPYYNPLISNQNDPHVRDAALIDIDGGKMDGFIRAYRKYNPSPTAVPDVMGYHDSRQIPNYWAYAQNFVLQDHLFSSSLSWSLPNHDYLVSGWAAKCTDPNNPMS
jgi:phospholipase C